MRVSASPSHGSRHGPCFRPSCVTPETFGSRASRRFSRPSSCEDRCVCRSRSSEGGTNMSDKMKKGAEVFEEVIGYPPPERGPAFLKLTVENLFADVWAREGLSIR